MANGYLGAALAAATPLLNEPNEKPEVSAPNLVQNGNVETTTGAGPEAANWQSHIYSGTAEWGRRGQTNYRAKLPSNQWRDVIQKVWHTDPLICPRWQHPLRLISVSDQAVVIEKMLRHLGLWTEPKTPSRAPPDSRVEPRTYEAIR